MNNTLMTWDTDHYYLVTGAYFIIDILTYFVNNSNANEMTYDISIVNLDGQNDTVIWDRIEISDYGCDYIDIWDRINVGQNVTIWALAQLQYDNHELGTGDTIHFGDEIMTWNGTHFTASYTKHLAGLFAYTLNSTGSNELTYGITVGANDPMNLIFDRILIYDMWVNTTYCDVGKTALVAAALVSEYDNSSMGTGLVQINGTLGIESAGTNCTWTNTTTIPSYGGWIFLISFANWTTYNLTNINYNGWNVTYLVVDTDRIQILTTTISDSRVDYGTTIMINVTAKLEFLGDMLNGALGDTLYMNGTPMVWDVDHFYYTTDSVYSVMAYLFYVNTTGALQANHSKAIYYQVSSS